MTGEVLVCGIGHDHLGKNLEIETSSQSITNILTFQILHSNPNITVQNHLQQNLSRAMQKTFIGVDAHQNLLRRQWGAVIVDR